MLLSCPNGSLIIHGHYDTANSTTIIGRDRHEMASSDLESILSFLDSNRILSLKSVPELRLLNSVSRTLSPELRFQNFGSELSDSGLSGVED